METGGEWRMRVRVRDRGGDRWGVKKGWRQVGSEE